MKCIFKKFFTFFTHFWRTFLSTFVRKEDVDKDGKEEIIIDLNGSPSKSINESNSNLEKEE